MLTRAFFRLIIVFLINTTMVFGAGDEAAAQALAGTAIWDQAMLVSAIILALTFIGIFTEHLHGFERSKAATAGAVAMIIAGQVYGFYAPVQAVAAVDWNVVFLLAAMMTFVTIMIPTGGFNVLAY